MKFNVSFTSQDETRMQEIVDEFARGNLSEDLFKELKKLQQNKEEFAQKREDEVGKVKQAVIGIALTFDELMTTEVDGKQYFSKEVFLEYGRGNGWIPKYATAASASTTESEEEKKQRKTRTVKEGLVLFEIQPPNSKGGATKIYKAELVDGKATPEFPMAGKHPNPGAKMLWLFQQEGDLRDNLMSYKVDSTEVANYLESEEGQLEVDKWIDWMNTNCPIKLAEEANKPTEEATV